MMASAFYEVENLLNGRAIKRGVSCEHTAVLRNLDVMQTNAVDNLD
jgi:hypothetical protein